MVRPEPNPHGGADTAGHRRWHPYSTKQTTSSQRLKTTPNISNTPRSLPKPKSSHSERSARKSQLSRPPYAKQSPTSTLPIKASTASHSRLTKQPLQNQRIEEDVASEEDIAPPEYVPREKPLLAASNDRYAKELVAHSVSIMQEIWILPEDPPLPPGVVLQGHATPPPPFIQNAPADPAPVPQATIVAAAIAAADILLTPASIGGQSSASSSPSSDAATDYAEDGASDGSVSPTTPSDEGSSSPDIPHEVEVMPPAYHHIQATPPPISPLPQPTIAPPPPPPPVHAVPPPPATFSNNLLFFVHEVVRRSRTSCSTLEVAMCYIGAVRPHVRSLIRSREELHRRARHFGVSPFNLEANHASLTPLHDPRRTFMAALVLASKFQQDRAYSNKAWSKLSGLAPQEVTRCEKALGDALQWRLWVGRDVQIASDQDPAPVIDGQIVPGPAASNITIVPGVMGSGRCLSPVTVGISADMLEEEVYQEEIQLFGIHSTHGPGGVPGDGDVVAKRLINMALMSELIADTTHATPRRMQRTKTESSLPALMKMSAKRAGKLPSRSQSLHDLPFEGVQPAPFDRPPYLPGGYIQESNALSNGIDPATQSPYASYANFGTQHEAPLDDLSAYSSLGPCQPSGWDIDDLMDFGDEKCPPTVPMSANPYEDLYMDPSMALLTSPNTIMNVQAIPNPERTRSDIPDPSADPVQGLFHESPMDSEYVRQTFPDVDAIEQDIPMPETPKMGQARLPTSSVVGAFRPPRTPIPVVVFPASLTDAGWFPPPHLTSRRVGAYSPPTEYQLLPNPEPPKHEPAPAPAPITRPTPIVKLPDVDDFLELAGTLPEPSSSSVEVNSRYSMATSSSSVNAYGGYLDIQENGYVGPGAASNSAAGPSTSMAPSSFMHWNPQAPV